jgi:uncharacterized protein (DUF1697 family)
MKTYIALLRGINVSGQKLIKMERLREVMTLLGYGSVQTYIQSGNIIFQTVACDEKQLEAQISEAILTHFGFEVPVRITTLEELENVREANPFVAENVLDAVQPYVAFLSDVPDIQKKNEFEQLTFQQDKFVFHDRVMYLWYADSAANTKLTNNAIESKLKIKATSRNFKTLLKLIELAQK